MSKSKKYIGLKEWIKKIIQEEGGGSGGDDGPVIFKVTFSMNQEDGSKLDSDKSFDEIISAIDAGDIVIGSQRLAAPTIMIAGGTSCIQYTTGALSVEFNRTRFICLSGNLWSPVEQ